MKPFVERRKMGNITELIFQKSAHPAAKKLWSGQAEFLITNNLKHK